jgi:hypothetical protein
VYYLLYCLVYLTVWRAVLSTFYTYYLSIHLSLKETCMYLVKLVFVCSLVFSILVLSKLFFFLFPLYVLYVLYTQTQSHAIFCLFVVQRYSQVTSAYFSRHILFLSNFLSISNFFVFKQSLFPLRRLLYSILLLR